MLRLWMSKIHVSPGFCEDVFVLMQQKGSNMTQQERLCSLVFDEVSLKTAMTYDSKTDSIVGYENFGHLGSTDKVANHALVLMARGLLTKWKQPLGYFVVCNTTSAERLKTIVEHCITKLSAAGFTTVCVVCDQGPTNQQLFKMFGITSDRPYATVNDSVVNFLHDPPHLLKCLRNNLMKHDFELNGNIIQWDYIVKFHERDSRQTLKLAPKITDRHLHLPPFAAMHVRLAAQIFSHSVAAGISTHVSFGVLPEEAVHTAKFIGTVDGLFDCLNSSTITSAKQFCRPLSVNSAHWKHLHYCTSVFQKLKVGGGKATVPCINGFLLTINSVKMLFERLHDLGFKFLLTNRLNQDCIENHFAVIRGRGGFRDNPDPYSFRSSFRQVIVKHLLCPPKTANCSDDMTGFLLKLKDLCNLSKRRYTQTCSSPTGISQEVSLQMECFSFDQSDLLDDDTALEMNAVTYVAGYECKVVLQKHECVSCKQVLLKSTTDNVDVKSEVFLHFKLYSHCKQDSLHTPSDAVMQLLTACYNVFVDRVDEVKHTTEVLFTLHNMCLMKLNELHDNAVFDLVSAPCVKDTLNACILLFLRVNLYHKVKVINRTPLKTTKQARKNRKAMKVVHK